VTRKDMAHNIVYVSSTYYQQERRRDAFVCGPFNWLGAGRPQPGMQLFVKVRHGPNMYECNLQQGSREVTAVLEQGTPAAFQPLSEQQLAGISISSSSSSGTSSSSNITAGSCEGETSSGSSSGGMWQVDSSRQYGVVLLSENDQGLAAGQYAVFYQQGVCLGSAQILGGVERS
jgi:tRNA-specific 2-thiouridylase